MSLKKKQKKSKKIKKSKNLVSDPWIIFELVNPKWIGFEPHSDTDPILESKARSQRRLGVSSPYYILYLCARVAADFAQSRRRKPLRYRALRSKTF